MFRSLLPLLLALLSAGLACSTPEDCPQTMNRAHIRFVSLNETMSVSMVSENCHKCPYRELFQGVTKDPTAYSEIDMEFTQNFMITSDADPVYHSVSFKEYGMYTIEVNPFQKTFHVKVDREGHNYYKPLYFMIALTIAFYAIEICVENIISYRKAKKNSSSTPLLGSSPSKRVVSVDVFRGMDLCCMIFANYGAGQYWKSLVHATWDGITLSDFAFPIFVFIQGISLRISISSAFRKNVESGCSPLKATGKCTWKCIKRAIILYLLTWLINQSTDFPHLRILGVLAYFSIAGLVNSLVLLYMPVWHADRGWMTRWKARSEYGDDHERIYHVLDPLVPVLCAFTHWFVAMYIGAPGCPVGYTGPGGISENSKYEGCTGGIYRYIDQKVLGEDHMYHGAAVAYVYGGNYFECEGLLGMLNAIFMTYLGTFVSWVFTHIKRPINRVWVYLGCGLGLLLCGEVMCGFKQFDGYMPINKNKWNTTFIFVTSGTAFMVFGGVYLLVDVWKIWSGYPVKAMGMNSILIYIVHEFVGEYIPFRYHFEKTTHWTCMVNSYILGVGMWIVIANEFYRQKLFFKI